MGVSANMDGIGPKVKVSYEREGRVFNVDEVKETLDLGFHNNTKVFYKHLFCFHYLTNI